MELGKEEFARQVKEALHHVYDVTYLPTLGLTRVLTGSGDLSWQERAQSLRRILLQAIDCLDPGGGLPLRAAERHSHAILSACVTRSMNTQAVMEELAISERQYWRDRKKAVAALVDLLWADYMECGQRETASTAFSGESDIAVREADLMAARSTPEELNPVQMLHEAVRTLEAVIQSRGIGVQLEVPETGLLVYADHAVLRQVLLNLLSHSLDLGGTMRLSLYEREQAVEIAICVDAQQDPQCSGDDVGLVVAQRLVEVQGGYLRTELGRGRHWMATVGIPRAQSLPILVIDDNETIIKLFRRFLVGTRYRVIGAESGPRALELIREMCPAAVTLDVMMPGQIGWDTLQALKAVSELQGVPVIACSILDEPQLAYSLGADDFVRKPVSQPVLLRTLNRWLRPTRPPAPRKTRPAETADS